MRNCSTLRRLPPTLLAVAWAFLGGASLRAAENAPTNADAGRDNPVEKLAWQVGPASVALGDKARLKFPAGFRFVGSADAQRLLQLSGNRPSGDELGVLVNLTNQWWVVFEFDEVGYVKDDEKKDLQSDKLLTAIRKGTDQGNAYRREQGLPEMTILGWHTPPTFQDQTKNLEWAILAESRGEKFVNHNVRVLGRKGVMAVTLVEDLAQLDATLPGFRDRLAELSWVTGESHAEYRPGDRVAQFGLGALVVGGAAAAAAKLGLFGVVAAFFKKIWKLVVLAVVALAGGIKKLFGGGRSGGRENPPTPPTLQT
ncbi:MAG: DUF2167 domain-containing protein [Verrucomicrobiota bacterium]